MEWKTFISKSEMSDDEWVDVAPNAALLVPEWSCADTFKAGRMFLNMTYAEVYEGVQKLHVAVGGVHLDVQCRPFGKASTDALPGIVKFYCPHSRDHKDQKGRKEKKNPEATRADRSEEEKRVYFNKARPCDFHFVIRRKKESVVPRQEASDKACHSEYMKCPTKCDWYIDGSDQQIAEGRKRTPSVCTHQGHPRNIIPVSIFQIFHRCSMVSERRTANVSGVSRSFDYGFQSKNEQTQARLLCWCGC